MAQEFTPRKKRILQAVVDGYVETGEPIGSEWLASRYDFGCRSATLRNEMYEMSEEGLLKQPHTSAGRIPTAVGYRYYVDNLMRPEALKVEPPVVERQLEVGVLEDVNEIVRDACRFLTQLTAYPSVASAPTRGDVLLHRVFLAPADSRHVLLVALFSTGHTESRIVELSGPVTARDIQGLSERINAALAGRRLHELSTAADKALPPAGDFQADAMERLRSALAQVAGGLNEDDLMIEGASLMFRQQEFRDVLRMEQMLAALIEGNVLSHVLRQIGEPQRVSIVIGPESNTSLLDDCSIVTHRYQAGSKGWGYIGVLGPTRMRYDRAVAAVELTARALSSVLSRTSFA